MGELTQENKGLGLQEALKEWQEALRLQDWDIHARVIPEYEYRCTAKTGARDGGSQAENHIDTWHNEAWIAISEHSDNQEKSLVHELSHLLINGLDRAVCDLLHTLPDGPAKTALEDNIDRQLEIAVNNVTRALISVRDKAHEVRKQPCACRCREQQNDDREIITL